MRERHGPEQGSASNAACTGLAAWLEWHALAGVDGWTVPSDQLINPSTQDWHIAPLQGSRGRPTFPAREARAMASAGVPDRGGAGTSAHRPPPPVRGFPDRADQAAGHIAARCESLDDIRTALEAFEGCSLRATATRLCFADGAPDASLMLIGEAPGAVEDRQGKPFVGPSGQLLDRILGAVGFDRSSVWITNAVFWRPPGNRKPTSSEIAVCAPFLSRQIALLKPRHIVLLGGSAANAVLGRSDPVGQLRRQALSFSVDDGTSLPVTVTYHPSNLLRNPLNKKHVWRDFLAVASAMRHS